MSRLASESISITLDGHPVELVPSLRAALTLARQFNTYGALIQKIGEGDTRAIAATIAAGARFPGALLAVLSQIEREGILRAITLLQPALVDFVISLAGPAATPNGEKATGEPITFERFHEQLFEIATGNLGWSPAEAWSATPAEILAAHKGRMALLKMIFGSGEAEKEKPKLTLDQKMRAFFAGTGTRKAGKGA